MSDDSQRPIIVKKIRKAHHGHHGGAWKIAYADFVTAMMAFFLLMWLLGSTTKAQRMGISDYFKTPLKVALMGGEGSGDATSLIKGGGEDLTRATGQVKRGAEQDKSVFAPDRDLAKKLAEQIELEKLQQMKQKLEQIIENNEKIKPFKNQLKLDITAEGLRIQIVDEQNRPMFDSGRAELKSYTREILAGIAEVLNDVPNRLSLSGHTDATPFPSKYGTYSNWELSADRANASRRELISSGLKPEKMMRVVGLADAVPLEANDPFNPSNRRISIIVLNKRTEESMIRSGSKDAGNPQEADSNSTLTKFSDPAGAPQTNASQPVTEEKPVDAGAPVVSPPANIIDSQDAVVAPENEIPPELRRPAR
ncbi:MAG: chemotaxis protein MotB [Pseudomonadota bacterium]|nr:chemotaxis protein MotB [Pseudomonadota bacterium]